MNRKHTVALLLFLILGGNLLASTAQAISSDEKTVQTTAAMSSSTQSSPSQELSQSDSVDISQSSSQTDSDSAVNKPKKAINSAPKAVANEASVFNPQELSSYPLGVGTEFTAFAGGTLTIGQQNVTGYMGANTINGKNSWPTYFGSNLTTGGLKLTSEPKENVTVVANTINEILANNLAQTNTFPNQKLIAKNGAAKIPSSKKAVHTADQLQAFQANGITAEHWQLATQNNLTSISSSYQRLTRDKGVAVSDATIKASQKIVKDPTRAKTIHQITLDLSGYTGSTVPVILLDMNLVQADDELEITYKGAASRPLPYLIFNWQTTGTFTWGWNNHLTVTGDTTIKELGNHIIHSFPKASQVSIIASKFYGSLLVPTGNILVSNAGPDVMHSSYVAGGDMEIQSELNINMANENQFDISNWPGTRPPGPETPHVPTIHLTTEDGNTVGDEMKIFKGQPIRLMIVTTDYDGTDVEVDNDQGVFSEIPILEGLDLQDLSVGKHVITIRIPGQKEIFTKIAVTVSGYLTLDQVPNLHFGNKGLSQFSQDPTFQLVSENNERLKITDERFPTDGKTPWSLSVALSDFSNGKKPIAGKISFVSAQGAQGLLNGTVTSDGKLTFDKTDKPNLNHSVSESLASETKLSITDAKQVETGAYQATLRWTLSNAPQ